MPRKSVTVTKNWFMVSATLTSLEIIVSSSIKTILFFRLQFVREERFHSFPKFLIDSMK